MSAYPTLYGGFAAAFQNQQDRQHEHMLEMFRIRQLLRQQQEQDDQRQLAAQHWTAEHDLRERQFGLDQQQEQRAQQGEARQEQSAHDLADYHRTESQARLAGNVAKITGTVGKVFEHWRDQVADNKLQADADVRVKAMLSGQLDSNQVEQWIDNQPPAMRDKAEKMVKDRFAFHSMMKQQAEAANKAQVHQVDPNQAKALEITSKRADDTYKHLMTMEADRQRHLTIEHDKRVQSVRKHYADLLGSDINVARGPNSEQYKTFEAKAAQEITALGTAYQEQMAQVTPGLSEAKQLAEQSSQALIGLYQGPQQGPQPQMGQPQAAPMAQSQAPEQQQPEMYEPQGRGTMPAPMAQPQSVSQMYGASATTPPPDLPQQAQYDRITAQIIKANQKLAWAAMQGDEQARQQLEAMVRQAIGGQH